MRISLVIAAHNEGPRLSQTLQSVVDTCNGLDFEVIVVDDGSTDGSAASAIRRFSRARLITSTERQGPGPAKDRGAREAKGDTLVMLDAHTKPEEGAIRQLVERVEHLQGDAICVPQIPILNAERWQNDRGKLGQGYALNLRSFNTHWKPLRDLRAGGPKNAGLYESPALIGCAFALSRQLYETLSGHDICMRDYGIEDIDLGLKSWLMGHPILLDPMATIGHRFRDSLDDYHVPVPQIVANQLRMARKNFTESVWADWVRQARSRFSSVSHDSPEGLWTQAWSLFEANRESAEEERAYLLSRRVRDEFWYSSYFGLDWPSLGAAASATQPGEAPSGTAPGSIPHGKSVSWMDRWSPELAIRQAQFGASPSPPPPGSFSRGPVSSQGPWSIEGSVSGSLPPFSSGEPSGGFSSESTTSEEGSSGSCTESEKHLYYAGVRKGTTDAIGVSAQIKTCKALVDCEGTDQTYADATLAWTGVTRYVDNDLWGWAQLGYERFRVEGKKDIQEQMYTEVKNGPNATGVLQRTAAFPAVDSLHFYECRLNQTTGQWFFKFDGRDNKQPLPPMASPTNPWVNQTGNVIQYNGEIHHKKTQMPGVANNKCTFKRCRYYAKGQQGFLNPKFVNADLWPAGDYYIATEWGQELFGNTTDAVAIWDKLPPFAS
jgi:glycosyltransferase involved in cell wall biosynthesis